MKRTLAALAILLALTVAFWWKLTIAHGWTWLEGSDFAIQVRPWLDLQAREIHAGRIPLWDPYEWGGHTLIGQVQPGITNPLNWILFAMPLRDGHIPISTLHWYWVLIHWLGAVAAYALCRDLGAGFVASLLGACVFAMTGLLGHTDWPQILMTCIWIPVIVLFFLRVVRDRKPWASAALGGVAMGMAFLSGHHVIPTYTALTISVLWVALIVRRPAHIKYAAAFMLIAALVSAVQVLPALRYSRQAIRWAGGPRPTLPGDRVPYSVHEQYAFSLSQLPAIVLPIRAEPASPYVGITALLLATVAVVRRRRAAWWLAGITLAAILIAFARDIPLYWLAYRFVPMVEKAREPAFAIAIAQAGIAALAALGLCGLPRWVPPIALAAFLVEAVWHAPRLSRFDRPGSFVAMQQSHSDLIAFLKAQPGWFRVDFDDEAVPYNVGDLYGIEQFGGALSSMPLSTHRVLGQAETARAFGVRYFVGRTPRDPAQVEVFASRSGLKVFRDPRIGEPIQVFHRPCDSEDRLRLLSRINGALTIDAEMACPGIVSIGEAYYRGWMAWVDGQKVPVREIQGVCGVEVKTGVHRIELRYRDLYAYWGFVLSLTGLGAAYWLARMKPYSERAMSHTVYLDNS